MTKIFNLATLLLIFCVGLHVPRSYALLYLFALIVWVLTSCAGEAAVSLRLQVSHCLGRYTAFLLVLCSIAYVSGMVWWRFWELSVDALDIVNALFLPALLFVVGMRAVSLERRWCARILLSYALGGLLYALAALFVAREPWWDVTQIFPLSIQVAWGSQTDINVRSVEQTAYPALLLISPALLLLMSESALANRRLGVLFMVLGLIGGHVVWSFNGRLAWLSLGLAVLPVVWRLCAEKFRHKSADSRKKRMSVLLAVVALTAVFASRAIYSIGDGRNAGWGQGLCDERISFFGSMVMRLHQMPWGGRLLEIPYSLCGDNSASGLLAAKGGTVSMAHNVILEVYYSVGLLPSLLLLFSVLPCSLFVCRRFAVTLLFWDWRAALMWSWFCFLVCQWTFQPLHYADGLLYYFSFFVLGFFLREPVSGLDAH